MSLLVRKIEDIVGPISNVGCGECYASSFLEDEKRMSRDGSERHDMFQNWLKEVSNEKTRQYIEERVIKQMEWYRKKSSVCKAKYQHWMTVSIILSGSIPVVSVFADGGVIFKVIIAALGAAVTGIGAYLSLQNYKELWNIYRVNREMLLSTLYLYFNHVGVFNKDIDQNDRDAILIDLCERQFQQDFSSWKNIIK